MRPARLSGILGEIEIAAAPGKTCPGASTRRPLQEPRLPDGGQRHRRDVARPDRTQAHGPGCGRCPRHRTRITEPATHPGKAGAKPSPPMPRFWKSMERKPVSGSPERAFRHGAMTSAARSGRSSALRKRRLNASTGRRFRISTRSSTAPKASMRTSATISMGSSGPTARPSCWAACWNRAASPPSARSTGSAARCR